eukprot:3788101-Amphidinium_carterae.1
MIAEFPNTRFLRAIFSECKLACQAKLGANAVLAVSMCIARAGAEASRLGARLPLKPKCLPTLLSALTH